MTSIWIDSTQGSLTRWTAIEVGLYLDSAGRILVDVTVLLQQRSPGADQLEANRVLVDQV